MFLVVAGGPEVADRAEQDVASIERLGLSLFCRCCKPWREKAELTATFGGASLTSLWDIDSVALEYAGGSRITLPVAVFIYSRRFDKSPTSLALRWLKYFLGFEMRLEGEITTKVGLLPTCALIRYLF